MKVLNVFYETQLVGKLTRDDELIYGFTYESTWQKSAQAFPLSLAMSLSQSSFGNKTTLSFFENLLPEGAVKENLERNHNVSGVFDFLSNYGKDCAGAIIVTEQSTVAAANPKAKLIPINMKTVYAAIEERTSVADVIADMNPGYLSLAGAQDKFPAIFDGKKFFLPAQGSPTTHIIKAPIQHSGIRESVFNEYYCMQLGAKLGFNIPKCLIVEGPHPLFVIERYDRWIDENKVVHRIHQQDFCQAQGITSEFKYEDKGGPTIKDNYALIQKSVRSANIISSIETFLDWVGFNLIIGNHDSHSKNISFLLRNNHQEIAPLYDLLSTAIYEKMKRTFSFKIGDRDDVTKIGLKQIHLLEKSLDLKEGVFHNRLLNLFEKISKVKDSLAREICKDYDVKIPKRISSLIDDRIKGFKLQGIK